MAHVEPRFEIREFSKEEEILAFIQSRSERRDISAGQRAMAVAMLYLDPEKGGRGKKTVPNRDGFSKARLSKARQVLRFSRELAEQVRDGSEKPDAALEKVKKQQEDRASAEFKLSKLQEKANDLAELVREERLTIIEAYYFATVNDLREDAILHMRIAAQTAAAVEQQMTTADEALKRAKGNLQTRLKAIAD